MNALNVVGAARLSPTVGAASLLKRWLLGTHQGAVQEMHLQAYLDEEIIDYYNIDCGY
jgi:hypothetical protein